jgi:hypothetical protein
VHNKIVDNVRPTLVDFTVWPFMVNTTDSYANVTFQLTVLDELSGFKRGWIYISSWLSTSFTALKAQVNPVTSAGVGVYNVTLVVPQYFASGVQMVQQITLDDHAGNSIDIQTGHLSLLGFRNNFTIVCLEQWCY